MMNFRQRAAAIGNAVTVVCAVLALVCGIVALRRTSAIGHDGHHVYGAAAGPIGNESGTTSPTFAVGDPAANNVILSTTNPTLTIAQPTTDVPTVPILIQGQLPESGAITNVKGGLVTINYPVAATSSVGTFGLTVTVNGGSGWRMGADGFGGTAIWGNNNTANNTFCLDSSSTGTIINANSGATILQTIGGTNVEVTSSFLHQMGPALGGLGTSSPFHWATTTGAIACGTGGTQTISAAQASTPGLIVTTGTLTSTCTLDFSTNGSTGWYMVDLSGAGTITGFGMTFKNGTQSQVLTTIPTGGAVIVWTHGANTIVVN
jgi:hypothetical protein